MFVLFLVVVMTTPQLMNSVLEEKMSRISEVLLGSVPPFELMLGKLLASTAVSAVLTMVYLTGGGVGGATGWGYLDVLDPWMVAWFVVFLLLSVLMYGSFFIAIGAACSDLKDAQNLMGPGDDAPDGAGADWTLVDAPAERLCRRRLAVSAGDAVPDAAAPRPPRTSARVAGHPRHAAHAGRDHGRRLGRRTNRADGTADAGQRRVAC